MWTNRLPERRDLSGRGLDPSHNVAGVGFQTTGDTEQRDNRHVALTTLGSITTTTLTIESMCERELAAWMDCVTTPGNTLMDAGFE